MICICDKVLSADVFESFKNISRKYCITDTISMTCSFKKDRLELLTDIGILLMVEKDIRGGIRNKVHRYAKANNKYIKY